MVALRAAEPADASAIAAIYAPYVTDTAISFEQVAPTSEVIATRMTSRPRLPWWVAVDDTTIVGYAYASPYRGRAAYRWSVEVSAYVASSHHGRGVGTALYQQLLAELPELGFVSAYAGVALPNPASVRLHERVGFELIGVFRNVGHKFGTWHDVGWWQLRLAEPCTIPEEPREWAPR